MDHHPPTLLRDWEERLGLRLLQRSLLDQASLDQQDVGCQLA